MKDVQGRIDIILSIPDEYKSDPELSYNYVRMLAEQLSELQLIKDIKDIMLVADIQETEEGETFLRDKEYYKDYYDAIFPNEL